MNSPDGRVKANAAIVPAGYQGAVSVFVTNTTNVILDIDGYFEPATTGTYQFYPLPPCRVVDTRDATKPQGLGTPYLQAQQTRDFPVLESGCIPQGSNPQAYSFNFTVVPHPAGQELGYLTVWPKGEAQPTVSTLNNPTATIVANAGIVRRVRVAISRSMPTTAPISSLTLTATSQRPEQEDCQCIRLRRAACWIRVTATARSVER